MSQLFLLSKLQDFSNSSEPTLEPTAAYSDYLLSMGQRVVHTWHDITAINKEYCSGLFSFCSFSFMRYNNKLSDGKH